MKKLLGIILSILLVVLIGSAVYVYSLINRLDQVSVVDSSGDALDFDDLGISDSAPSEKDTGIINILLFGVDRWSKDDTTRSDSIMIATIDKNKNTIKLTSLMRDMYVPIPGRDKNRINAAYAFGGPALAIKTVNTNFNLDIKRYATVDFFGLQKIIDKVGGVSIDVSPAEMEYINMYVSEFNQVDKESEPSPLLTKPGLQTLNGRQAVGYCRIRYVGNGDYERTERQRKVLSELFKSVKKMNVLKLPELAITLLPYVETNISKTEILTLGIEVIQSARGDIEQYRLPVDGTFTAQRISGMDVLVPDIDQNTQLLHEFIYGKE